MDQVLHTYTKININIKAHLIKIKMFFIYFATEMKYGDTIKRLGVIQDFVSSNFYLLDFH